MEIITVEYHQGKVHNNTDRWLKKILENGGKIVLATPIFYNGNVSSVEYVVEENKTTATCTLNSSSDQPPTVPSTT